MATGLALLGGWTTFLPGWGIKVEPHGIHFIFIFQFIAAYAILKYQLMNIRATLSKMGAFIVTFALYGMGYLFLAYFYTIVFNWDAKSFSFIVVSVIYGLITGFYFNDSRLRFQTTTEKRFIKGWYDYRIVQRKLADKLNNVAEKESILPVIQKVLDDELEIKEVRMVFLNNNKDTGVLTPSLIDELKETKNIVHLPKESFLPQGIAIPCFSDDLLAAVILVGAKRTEESFNEVDLDLFRTLAGEVSVILQRAKPLERALARATTAEEVADKAKMAMEKAQQMATLGMIALQTEHEIKNPMAAIDLHTGLLPGRLQLERAEDKEYLQKFVDLVKRNSQRISDIISKMREFGAPKKKERLMTDINALLSNEVLFLLEAHLKKKRIKLDKKLGEFPKVMADPNALEQAFLNICLNAIQAMNDEGALTVTTSQEQRRIRGQIVDAVVIKIKDTGEGISKENMEKIFLPMFTTRYQGVGLGLSISSRIIIEEHQGDISVESEVGKGTEVTVALPYSL